MTDEVDYDRLGQIACCSAYHCQRMFAYMVGVPLSEYLCRRLSLAAADLQNGEKAPDVALKYRYRSPAVFNRAFQTIHGAAEDWRYYIAVSSTQPAGELEEYTVPACTWAIFPGSGKNLDIQELERRAVAEWLPTSGYEYADGPDVELCLNADPENAQFEVWIPVRKK